MKYITNNLINLDLYCFTRISMILMVDVVIIFLSLNTMLPLSDFTYAYAQTLLSDNDNSTSIGTLDEHQNYTNVHGGLQLQHPQNWLTVKGFGNTIVTLNPISNPLVYLTYNFESNSNGSLKEIAENLKLHSESKNPQLLQSRQIILNGMPAHMVLFNYQLGELGGETQRVMLIAVKDNLNNRFIIIQYKAPESSYDEFLDDVGNIIKSMVFTKITEDIGLHITTNSRSFSEYTNSEAGYKISYPADAIIDEENLATSMGDFDTTIMDKDAGWLFAVHTMRNYNGTLEQIVSETREELKKEMSKSFGDTITDMKPLKVGGQPALMFDVISEANGIKGSYIDMIANNLLYFFYIEADIDKFDGYADLFFTMLKSFKLTNISEGNANAPKIETKEPAFKSTTTYQFVKSWGVTGDGKGQFSLPQDIAVDSSTDNVYIADTYNHRIQKFDSDGKYITQWKVEDSDAPDGISIDSLGNVYASELSYHLIQKFDRNGHFITKWGDHGTGDGELVRPVDISLDSSDNVYVVEEINHRVQKFDSNGNFITTWGSKGTGDGQFDRPYGVAVDSKGNVYVGDSDNYRIQKFDSNGNFITKWGSKGTGDGQFGEGYTGPSRMSLDSSDNVYVVDSGNYRIQKFDSNGNFITKWGSEGTKDGQFVYPSGISVDSKGNVYVTDTNTDHIQVFAPSE